MTVRGRSRWHSACYDPDMKEMHANHVCAVDPDSRANRHEFRLEAPLGHSAQPVGCHRSHFFHLACPARRSGGVLRGAGRECRLDRQYPNHIGSGPPASRTVPALRQRTLSRQSRPLADNGPAGLDRPCRTASSVAGIVGLRVAVRRGSGASPWGVGGDAGQRTCRSRLPRPGHRQRGVPDLLRRPAVCLHLLLSARMGAPATRPSQRDCLLAAAARHRRLHGRRPHRGRLGRVASVTGPTGLASDLARPVRAGPHCPHHACRDAGGAQQRLRSHRARERTAGRQDPDHLRIPHRPAAGQQRARHGVLLPDGLQRSHRAGVRLAGCRRLRRFGRDRVRLCGRAGLRPDDGDCFTCC